MNWKQSVNQIAVSAVLSPAEKFLTPPITDQLSPIDRFHHARKQLIQLATKNNIKKYPYLSQLSIIGIVSATENYFRNIFSELIELCDVARKACSTQQMSYSSAYWNKSHKLARGLFDQISFHDAKKIKSASKSYCDIDWKQDTGIDELLLEYEKVCELRHCIAHASGTIAGKNATALGLDSSYALFEIKPDIARIQECIDICTNLVLSFNAMTFERTLSRWALGKWKNPKPTWNWKQDKHTFSEIYYTFLSDEDKKAGNISGFTNPLRCYCELRRELKKFRFHGTNYIRSI